MKGIRKAQPSSSDVHINRPLTNISVAFIQTEMDYIANRVFPVVPVQKQSDLYFVYDKGDWFRSAAKRRAPATESAGSGWELTTDNYFAHKNSFHKDIDEDTRANADAAINVEDDATTFVTQILMIQKDEEWADSFFKTGVWTTERAGVSSSPTGTQFLQWNDEASTPIEDITNGIITIKELTGYRPQKLVIHPLVFTSLKNHFDIVDRIKHTQTGVVTTELLAQLFDVSEVLISWAVHNTGPEKGTDVMEFITGKHALLVYVAPSPSLLQPSGGYSFTWTGLLGAGAFGNRMKRFELDKEAATRIEGDLAYDQKLVAADMGLFFLDAVA